MIKSIVPFLLLLQAFVSADDNMVVTCGSVIKLKIPQRGSTATYHLYSEDIQMHGGSGQQIVTWMKNDPSNTGTLWQIRPKHHDESAEQEYPSKDSATRDTCAETAAPVQCGSTIRLTHLKTTTNLHSHGVKSPLSRQQEVTGFGTGDGKGDAGDNWIVECNTKVWKRGTTVRIRHVDTDAYLGGTTQATFNQNNCGHGCPILNHMEAFGRRSKDELTMLEADIGIYMHK
ncbi:Stromal cell-derived factor 2-like protein 1 [Seminavis robusta]|uniref:Stromal cell-derived factor 2-like protein 1 n=1 Tax=Seminavis robusta TaxID=568900 RepID=A0A9N8HBK0_9STRA|nr:Stromal cell-derived factor 2-like protein 1 [Seminavis robusta]|eukprot:Sro264_g102450.1 Stromal cell-derived factor 2-like protein 1 (230) ;mRNA; f:9804-10644